MDGLYLFYIVIFIILEALIINQNRHIKYSGNIWFLLSMHYIIKSMNLSSITNNFIHLLIPIIIVIFFFRKHIWNSNCIRFFPFIDLYSTICPSKYNLKFDRIWKLSKVSQSCLRLWNLICLSLCMGKLVLPSPCSKNWSSNQKDSRMLSFYICILKVMLLILIQSMLALFGLVISSAVRIWEERLIITVLTIYRASYLKYLHCLERK